MKVYERLWCSVSVLVGAVLAVFAFVPGAWRTGILLLVFAVWGIWVFMIILRPRIAWRRAQRNFLGRRRSTGDGQARFRAEETMVKHVNYRISARLHSAYSNAFRNQTKKMLEERVQIIKDQQDDGCDYDGFGKKGKNGGFVIQDGVSADEDLGELPL